MIASLVDDYLNLLIGLSLKVGSQRKFRILSSWSHFSDGIIDGDLEFLLKFEDGTELEIGIHDRIEIEGYALRVQKVRRTIK